MGDGLFHLDSNGTLEPMTPAPYASDAALHLLVLAQPALLAGGQSPPDGPRRWSLVLRGTGKGVDPARQGVSLFVDQDAVPTLVSVRNAPDMTSRREIVGQVLDLLANGLRNWPIDELRATFETTQRRLGQDPGQMIAALCDDPETTPDEFFAQVRENLDDGRIRMVFVADVVPVELVRMVEFLSDQLHPAQVSAVDITQYRAADIGGSVIVPALPARTTPVPTHLGPRIEEHPDADPATDQLVEQLRQLAAATELELVEEDSLVEVLLPTGQPLARADLVWDALEVPVTDIPTDDVVAVTTVLARLTRKKLSLSQPSVPAHNVMEHWDEVGAMLRRLAERRRNPRPTRPLLPQRVQAMVPGARVPTAPSWTDA